MTQTPQHDPSIPSGNSQHDQATGLDVLIGRIIDGEATMVQRESFETMAAADPTLWRVLAIRQQDMSMLAAHVEPRLNAAETIELPEVPLDMIEPADAATAGRLRLPWWISLSGWAAVVALAVAWGYSGHQSVPANGPTGSRAAQPIAVNLTPEEHLREYLRAPYVLNEMPPTLLNTEDLPDGRLAVSFLRRIVEVRYVDSPEDLPDTAANGEMQGVPTKLAKEPPPAFAPQD